MFSSRFRAHPLSAALAMVGITLSWGAPAAVLQIDAPWQITGTNTGNLGGVGVTAVAANNRWASAPIDDNDLYDRADLIGSLAAAAADPGDMFTLSFEPGQTETLTVTFVDAVLDPIFVIGDVDFPGATVTITDGGDIFTSNADGLWTGNVLSVLSGFSQGTIGEWAAVQYLGLHPGGSSFQFVIDYTGATFSADGMAVGVHVVPGPASGLLMLTGLLGIARRLRFRTR